MLDCFFLAHMHHVTCCYPVQNESLINYFKLVMNYLKSKPRYFFNRWFLVRKDVLKCNVTVCL